MLGRTARLRSATLLVLICCIVAPIAAIGTVASAATTADDLVLAGRALAFLEKRPRGDVRIGIVYDSTRPKSADDAARIQEILSGGLKVGVIVLTPAMVDADTGEIPEIAVCLLTEGMGSGGMKVAAACKARHIPCITTDFSEVRSGACVVGVRAQPEVEILVNRAVAAETGLLFSAIFRMMITEF